MLDIKLMREICLNISNKLLYWFNNYKDERIFLSYSGNYQKKINFLYIVH